MRILITALLLSFICFVNHAWSQGDSAWYNENSQDQTNSMEVSNNPEKLLSEIMEKRELNAQRLIVIDKSLDQVFKPLVEDFFSIEINEFRMLRLQSQNPSAARKFFKKNRKVYQDSIVGIAYYFDDAYEALRDGQLWFGKEERIIEQDVKLYQEMESILREAVAQRSDGDKIIELMDERDRIIEEKYELGPMNDYLIKRRRWWNYHPTYAQSLEEGEN